MSFYAKDDVIAFKNKSDEIVCWECVPEDKIEFKVIGEECMDDDTILTCDKCGEIIYF